MEELVCKECKGRKFRKISDSEYVCEYCGAVIKAAVPPAAAPQVMIMNQAVQPQTIVTPFPPEISYAVTLRSSFWDVLTGKLVITPDKFMFVPDSSFNNKMYTGNLSPREWRITDITGQWHSSVAGGLSK